MSDLKFPKSVIKASRANERQVFIREAAMRAMQGMGVNYVHAFEKCDAQACVMAAELLWQALQESEKK